MHIPDLKASHSSDACLACKLRDCDILISFVKLYKQLKPFSYIRKNDLLTKHTVFEIVRCLSGTNRFLNIGTRFKSIVSYAYMNFICFSILVSQSWIPPEV